MQIRVTGDPIENGSPLFYRRLNAGRALTINQDLQSNNPNNLPGVGIRASRFANSSDDTLRGREQKVTIELTLQNYLAPTKDLTIESYPNGELTADPVEVGELGTMESRTVMLDVRLDPEADFLFSEGDRQLILRLGDGEYEDFVTLFVPTELPGWKSEEYVIEGAVLNPEFKFIGIDIKALDPRFAWTVGQTTFDTVLVPFSSHIADSNKWTPPQLFTIDTAGILASKIYTVAAVNAQTAWAGDGPRHGVARIYRTIDSGNTWSQTVVRTITPFVNGIHFWNAKDGIFFGDPHNGTWGIGPNQR